MLAGTVYLWDAKYSIDNIDQTSSSGAALQLGCTQLTKFARTATVCEGTNEQELQASLLAATTHATCTLAGEQLQPTNPCGLLLSTSAVSVVTRLRSDHPISSGCRL